MANDGKVEINIITNAQDAAKQLDNVSKSFDKTGNSAEKVTSVFNSLQNGVNNNIEALREMALGGGQNSKEFQRLAQQTREYKKSLDDANKAVNSAIGGNQQQAGQINKLAGAVKGLVGAYLGVQGIRAVINYSNQAVSAFRTQEKAVLQLNQTLQNAGVYSYEYSQSLQQLASEIQSYSNYGDEAVIKAQALGQAYVGNIKISKELTKATVDFASATGMDLEQAFTLVGKSIGSQTNALGRYGISLSKGMTESQKMDAIQKQLAARYEGTAAKMADSSVQLQNKLGDLSEAFGRNLDPAVKNTQNILIKGAETLTIWLNRVRSLRSEIKSLNMQDLQLRVDSNNEIINRLKQQHTMKGQNAKRIEQLEADNAAAQIQMRRLRLQEKFQAEQSLLNGNKNKLNDDYGSYAVSSGSNVVNINQAKSKQNAIKAETAKIIEQKGAYQQLQDKVSSLTQKLRDLAAEQQVGSADWVQYKQDLTNAQKELENVNQSLEENGIKIDDVSKRISSSLSSGLISALRSGGSAFDIFSNIAVGALQKILDKMLEMAVIKPLLNSFSGGIGGSLLSFFGFKNGGVFKNGNVIPFAKGGLVNKPTLFPMANGGTGLMGEAGTEAVMPLKRMSNGKLGVESSGGNGTVVNIYNQSQSQIETRKRDNGSMDIIIKRVNEALMNERTSSGFRAAYQREDRKGVQAC